MTGYTKLFGSIIASTIWEEDDQTRIIWITMLAMANQHGEVESSIPGLAKFAKIPIEATQTALKKLSSPDKYSRSKEFEGRRIEEIDGGWTILNHGKYRLKSSEDDQREKTRIRVERKRRRDKGLETQNSDVTACNGVVTPGNACNDKKRAEVEVEADEDSKETGIGCTVIAYGNPFHSLIEQWNVEFEIAHGMKYHFRKGVDGKAASSLLNAQFTTEEIIETAKKCWLIVKQESMYKGKDLFNIKKASSLSTFAAAYNQIRVDLSGVNVIRDFDTSTF